MLRQTTAGVSRRQAIRFGVGATVATATISRASAASEASRHQVVVEGAIDGRVGAYRCDIATGRVTRGKTDKPVQCPEATRHFRLPTGHTLEDQSVNGDLLVRNTSREQASLAILHPSRELKAIIEVFGSVGEASFSADGSKIAFTEHDESATRLVVVRANGTGRQVLKEVESSIHMRGISWSPLGCSLAVVAYDWHQLDEAKGYPVPASYRMEVFEGSRSATRLKSSHWLGQIEWVTV